MTRCYSYGIHRSVEHHRFLWIPQGIVGFGIATGGYLPGVFGLGSGRSWLAYLPFTMAVPQPFDYTDRKLLPVV